MSEFGVDFVVGKKATVAGLAKGSKGTLGHLFEHLVHLSHLAIDKTLLYIHGIRLDFSLSPNVCWDAPKVPTCIFSKMPLSQLLLRAFQSLQMRPLF